MKKDSGSGNDPYGAQGNQNHLYAINSICKMAGDTIATLQLYKAMDLMGAADVQQSFTRLKAIIENLTSFKNDLYNKSEVESRKVLELSTKELAKTIEECGTKDVGTILCLCCGRSYVDQLEQEFPDRYRLIRTYCRPFRYRLLPRRSKKVDIYAPKHDALPKDINASANYKSLEAFDLATSTKNFGMQIYGLSIIFQCHAKKCRLIVDVVVDNIEPMILQSPFAESKLNQLVIPKDHSQNSFDHYLKLITLKDLLAYTPDELTTRYLRIQDRIRRLAKKPMGLVTKTFIASSLHDQRQMILELLVFSEAKNFQYLAYLLYDLLTDDSKGSVDSNSQTILFDSLPWHAKSLFRMAMQTTNTYTSSFMSNNEKDIPLAQQICMMKASEDIKEKAMTKLKEVKSKPEDSGGKARQYLDSILKIPFGVYRQEPILNYVSEGSDIIKRYSGLIPGLVERKHYGFGEQKAFIEKLEGGLLTECTNNLADRLHKIVTGGTRSDLVNSVRKINTYLRLSCPSTRKITHSGRTIEQISHDIDALIKERRTDIEFTQFLVANFDSKREIESSLLSLSSDLSLLKQATSSINESMAAIRENLNSAVHAHDEAKRQIERIIGQWINGSGTGYCFGFEGPPGVGKTSLATKGIAKCLKDETGKSRPFALIAIGGSSNASTIDGHSYTYVGSTYGRIVDILIQTQCMNPIIFIDEVDKVSKTENGREIISVLTHLIDSSQNDSFQDKYFSGVPLDLSRALFILSYNDPSAVDRVLLDRIHRIKFSPLTLEEKLVISDKYLVPNILDKMGLNDTMEVSSDCIRELIVNYTQEAGVRKLKELIFEIAGEVNLDLLSANQKVNLPIKVTKDCLKSRYLKRKIPVRPVLINDVPRVGVVNGMWANSLGKGGILHIQCEWYATNTPFELRLTGLQGDTMKESMQVAKSVALNMVFSGDESKEVHQDLERRKKNNYSGIHVHVPEGATPKDGPSAGGAIATSIYSLLISKPVPSDLAMTGELCLSGKISKIGGLELKLGGGRRAGVRRFLLPRENKDEYDMFLERTDSDFDKDTNISVILVDSIQDVLDEVFTIRK